MKIGGIEVVSAVCVVAVDGSAVWVDGVVFRPDPPCCAGPKNAGEEKLRGELEATKTLLTATQEMHSRTIADFCALRDALPRTQVEKILAAVGEEAAHE